MATLSGLYQHADDWHAKVVVDGRLITSWDPLRRKQPPMPRWRNPLVFLSAHAAPADTAAAAPPLGAPRSHELADDQGE
jgi:hypothetical protein